LSIRNRSSADDVVKEGETAVILRLWCMFDVRDSSDFRPTLAWCRRNAHHPVAAR
jgi:hypothetical protein